MVEHVDPNRIPLYVKRPGDPEMWCNRCTKKLTAGVRFGVIGNSIYCDTCYPQAWKWDREVKKTERT